MVRKSGLINLSRRELCEAADIPDGSFPHVMGCTFAEFVVELQSENVEQGIAPVSKSRTSATLRKEHILAVAVTLAKAKGYQEITRDGVAEAAGISFGLVTKYFGTMSNLKRAVMGAAIAQGVPEIVAQGLANGDKRARKAPAELKLEAARILSNA